MELVFRLFRPAVLIFTEVADQIPGLDRNGLVEHDDPIHRQRFLRAFQQIEIYVLVDAFQLAELAFATDRDNRSSGQL
ncbi:hypothetical protein D9M71_766230 [compost metagenome]